MSSLVRFLLIFALCATLARGLDNSEMPQTELPKSESENARGLATNESPADLKKNTQIFMGIYKNYKSTYLGNKTTSEYKKRLRDRVSAPALGNNGAIEEPSAATEAQPATDASQDMLAQELRSESNAEALLEAQTDTPTYDNGEAESSKKRRKRKRKYRNQNGAGAPQRKHDEKAEQEPTVDDGIERYHVGPGLNVSLDMNADIVRVKLDGDNLREILAARWLSLDNSEEGRGKKYDMMTKVLPLFILPFLIQSAIVPFLVTKLKLLLVKSILVGKLAIFLLIISAIKNSNKMMQSYEVAPSYWAGEPSRRSELAAAASSAAYNGYRVEGKPTTWIS
ncbi:uncharacterized protein LOC115621723 [Scaptodrosophila lebanonensis]|uniref:Uncharacterized protein LOC115621723 n=1 Tax=Drosophila lebanonensis TaxID=7225 RepID=A0A6J2T300_DROLE|nr:uncharacterized protein LOC115621723 [Scaptodrosophila lebanonensis]